MYFRILATCWAMTPAEKKVEFTQHHTQKCCALPNYTNTLKLLTHKRCITILFCVPCVAIAPGALVPCNTKERVHLADNERNTTQSPGVRLNDGRHLLRWAVLAKLLLHVISAISHTLGRRIRCRSTGDQEHQTGSDAVR